VLDEVARMRVLSAEHLHHLAFSDVSVRMANRRLLLMVRHRLLVRHYLPDIEAGIVVRSRRPLYSLTRLGAELVEGDVWPSARFIPTAWAVTRHNLIATDLLVAVASAGRRTGLQVETLPEAELRKRLRSAREGRNRFPTGVLPDGAFIAASAGFCVEVIRAGVKGGNKSLRAKMQRYVELNRSGFFRTVFGVEHLRAVLLVTTSKARVCNFQKLATGLPHGRNLFWSTYYERKGSLGMTFAPDTVLGSIWVDGSGNEQAIKNAISEL
jgi:hypothetical protein